MTPATHIRKTVFGFSTQHEFAAAIGYSQAHISRFEDGAPFSSEAQSRIRAYAKKVGIAWDNNLFFEVPAIAAQSLPEASSPRAA